MKSIQKDLERAIKKIEDKKVVISKARDEIREIHEDLEQLLESFDSGVEGLEIGILEIAAAIDSISEVV